MKLKKAQIYLPNIWQSNNTNFQRGSKSSNDWEWFNSITSLFGGHLKYQNQYVNKTHYHPHQPRIHFITQNMLLSNRLKIKHTVYINQKLTLLNPPYFSTTKNF